MILIIENCNTIESTLLKVLKIGGFDFLLRKIKVSIKYKLDVVLQYFIVYNTRLNK